MKVDIEYHRYVCVEPAIGICEFDIGIFAGHVVCLTVKAETATYSKALTVSEQRPPVNKGHFFNSPWLTVVYRFDCIFFSSKLSVITNH